MNAEPDQFAHVRDLLPEDTLPVVGVRLVLYMDSEGRTVMTHNIDGTAPTTTVLGLMEWLKHHLLTEQAHRAQP